MSMIHHQLQFLTFSIGAQSNRRCSRRIREMEREARRGKTSHEEHLARTLPRGTRKRSNLADHLGVPIDVLASWTIMIAVSALQMMCANLILEILSRTPPVGAASSRTLWLRFTTLLQRHCEMISLVDDLNPSEVMYINNINKWFCLATILRPTELLIFGQQLCWCFGTPSANVLSNHGISYVVYIWLFSERCIFPYIWWTLHLALCTPFFCGNWRGRFQLFVEDIGVRIWAYVTNQKEKDNKFMTTKPGAEFLRS